MGSNDLLSLEEVADWLGLSAHTLYQWRYRSRYGAKAEGPPGIRVGGRVRYRRADVEKWLDSQADRRPA